MFSGFQNVADGCLSLYSVGGTAWYQIGNRFASISNSEGFTGFNPTKNFR